MDVGESWAYRARSIDALVEVQVVRVGTNKPPRALVRFIGDEFEGREEWVPPARLKVHWARAGEFTAREQRWAAVTTAAEIADTAEDYAANYVFGTVIDRSLATLGYNATAGVTTIRDIGALAEFVGVEPDQLCSDPLAFTEDGALIVPWSTTRLIAQRAAERHPRLILREVEKEEAEHGQHAIHGKTYPASRAHEAWHIEAEHYAHSEDEPHNRPCWELLRLWCGAEEVQRRDELVELRREVARIGKIAQQAIAGLRSTGQQREADRLERELGVRVDELS